MDLREQRGVVLAATKKISRYGDRWKVPSQTNDGFYMVSQIEGENPVCSCPDWETRRQACKHIFAAIYTMRREEHPDGTTTITETIAVATER
jgi:hypothetical protein